MNFDYAAHQLRELAELIRPTFRNGRPEHLDMPYDAPDQLESAAAVLKAAGEVDKPEMSAFLRWVEEQPTGETELDVRKQLVAIYGLIEALPEVKP